jgi:hypothetical protein
MMKLWREKQTPLQAVNQSKNIAVRHPNLQRKMPTPGVGIAEIPQAKENRRHHRRFLC